MFVLERVSGDVIAISNGKEETRISIVESDNGHFILAIDAPAETKLVDIKPETEQPTQEQAIRASYRHELLMF